MGRVPSPASHRGQRFIITKHQQAPEKGKRRIPVAHQQRQVSVGTTPTTIDRLVPLLLPGCPPV